MRTLLVGISASLAVLIGFAGSAGASATVDLLWNGTTSVLTNTPSSSALNLSIVLTAGPLGVSAYSLTVTYDPTVVTVTGFADTSGGGDPHFGSTPGSIVDNGTSLQSFSGLAIPLFGLGTGLNSGNSTTIGTVTFHTLAPVVGTFAITPGFVNPLDAMADQFGANIAAPNFNGATLVSTPEPDTVSLLVLGLGGLALVGRRRN